MNIAKRFKDIITSAIKEAEQVPCDINDFRRGLQTMKEELDERVFLEGVETDSFDENDS
jgi:hypothetical protein